MQQYLRENNMPKADQNRKYDVILYGASGFVGRQTLAYFANLETADSELTWAIAGRSKDKLEAVRTATGQGAENAGIVVADAYDKTALDKLAKSAKVVLSTAGPFALYGSYLVEACVNNGTHYVDITGETPWVHGLIAQFHEAAKKTGSRIIPFFRFLVALQFDDLPGGAKNGGLLTPASGLGEVLLTRLRAAGMTLEAT
jgi:short subunit dehydrogenase-like uncharacterized protein